MAITVEESLKANKEGEDTLPQPQRETTNVDRPKISSNDSINRTLTQIQEGIGEYLNQYNKAIRNFSKHAVLVVRKQDQQLASIENILVKTKTAFKTLEDRYRKLDSRLRNIEHIKPPPSVIRYRPKPKPKPSLKKSLVVGGITAAALAAASLWAWKKQQKKPEADAAKVSKPEIKWEGKHAILESKTNILLDATNDIMFTAGGKIHFKADEIVLESDDITLATAAIIDPASADTVAVKIGGETTCNFECGAGDSKTIEDASPWERGVNAAGEAGGDGAGVEGNALIPTMPDTIPELPGGGPAFGGPGGLDPTNPFFGVPADPTSLSGGSGEGTAGGGPGAQGWGPTTSTRTSASDNDPSNTATPTSTTPAGPFNAITKTPKGGTFEAGTERLYHQGGNLQGLDPKLQHMVQQASKDLPAGYRVEIISGKDARSTGTTNHPSGIAMDVIIYDDKGKALPHDRSNHNTVKLYEKLYQSVVERGKDLYPGEKWIWGGTWISSAAGYGDPMHFQRYVPGVGSQGSGAYNADKGAPGHTFSPYLMSDKERKEYQEQVRRNIQQEKEAVRAKAAAEKKAKEDAAKPPPQPVTPKPETPDTLKPDSIEAPPKPQADASSMIKPQATDIFTIKGGGEVLSDAPEIGGVGSQLASLTTKPPAAPVAPDAAPAEPPAAPIEATPTEAAPTEKGTLKTSPGAIESLLRGIFGRPKTQDLPPVKAEPKGTPATQGANRDQKAAQRLMDRLGPEKYAQLPDDVKKHIQAALAGTGKFDANFVLQRTAPLLSPAELEELKEDFKDEGVIPQTTAAVPAANPDKPPAPTQSDEITQPPAQPDAIPVDPNKPPAPIEPDIAPPPEPEKPKPEEEPKPAETKKEEPKEQQAGPATADPEREHPQPSAGSYGGGKKSTDHNAGICMI